MDTPSRTVAPLSRSRTGTLSWQQRPSSRELSSKSPDSTSPTRSSHLRNAFPAPEDSPQLSRAQIAHSLPSKDPSWFRQTSDRGLDYRKTDERFETQTEPGVSRRLPGMSRESTPEPEKAKVADGKSASPPMTAFTLGDSNLSHHDSSASSVSVATGLGSPVPLSSAQKLEPPETEASTDDPIPASPTQRRMSPERSRSTSPTKGLGGFVQSAMMRRSDSVSKRWSAQIPQGLSRGDSGVGNRNSALRPSLSDMTSSTTNPRPGLEASPLPPHRPESSHGEATVVHPTDPSQRPTTPGNNDNVRADGSPRRPMTAHARSTSSANLADQGPDAPSTAPVSRTMDPRRWSPTKASWLESALNRPESPRHKRQTSQQPSWVRDRQSRGSVDMGRVNSFKEVTPVGLMRTPPPGSQFMKPSSTSVYGSPDTSKTKESAPGSPSPIGEESNAKKEPTEVETDSPTPVPHPQEQKSEPESSPATKSTRKEPPPLSPKPNFSVSPSSSREPTSSKPKPQSPVVDFRANLRKREIVKDTGPKEEPEFRNVFGRLKKTETSNYVAPDELKNNILRGKAALNVTGGPKKTERVDEFKESILQQKEAMKTGGGSVRRNISAEDEAPTKPASAAPEAIALRNNMSKTNSISRNRLEENSTPSKDANSSKISQGQTPISPAAGEDATPPASKPEGETIESQPVRVDTEDHKDIESINPGTEAEQKSADKAINPVRGLPSANVTANAAAVTSSLAAKGKLAGRINPALAGLLSRGPPAAAEGPKQQLVTPVSAETAGENASALSEPLTHMTKSRARGPKRRLPRATPATSPSPNNKEVGVISSPHVSRSQTDPAPVGSSASPSKVQSQPSTLSDTGPARSASHVTTQLPASFQDVLNCGLQQRLRTSPQLPVESSESGSRKPQSATRKVEDSGKVSPSSKPPVPPKPSSSPSLSTPVSKPQWSQQGRYASTSPLRKSYKEDRMDSPTTPQQKPIPGVTVAEARDSPRNKLPSPPVPPKRAGISHGKPEPPRLSRKMSEPSLVAQAAEAREVIAGFFKTFPNPRDRMDIDPQLILTGKADEPKMKTAKWHIWELTGDGKRQELPVNQEYILFEGSMYICVHVFETNGGSSVEVYLWTGDDVGEAALEDAQLFARKIAREHSCKLELIRQGKEPARFIQALGGIIITRRGSSSRSQSSALYMLCGRKHLGQVAFDEVDYSPRNLCSGFSFVISAPFGKLYMWKGQGSGPVETGAARLISMDLGLTGEFEEVTESEEPESFFDIFGGSREVAASPSSDHWHLKPKYDHYRTRLLRVNHELSQPPPFWKRRPTSGPPVAKPNNSIQEIEPFCLRDITPQDLFVLDTFFEIYV